MPRVILGSGHLLLYGTLEQYFLSRRPASASDVPAAGRSKSTVFCLCSPVKSSAPRGIKRFALDPENVQDGWLNLIFKIIFAIDGGAPIELDCA